MVYVIQRPSIVLPTIAPIGTESETVSDIAEHTSIDIPVKHLIRKVVHIVATEAVVIGPPGNLWVWVELSPVPSTISTAYWSAIGGGGGVLAPLAPHIEVGTGVTLTVHTFTLAWTIHSQYARVVVQTPVISATAFWGVQVLIEGAR